jgi:hypothetical protein
MSDARKALEFNKDSLTPVKINDQTYWMEETLSEAKPDVNEIHFIPAYDEFLISYRDRTASLSLTDNKNAVSNNGIFYPVLLENGQVTGTWKRSIVKNKMTITVTPFGSKKQNAGALLKGIRKYSDFTGREVVLL